jgi:energy-coupling factor transporter ATP-binding protein EcfA2
VIERIYIDNYKCFSNCELKQQAVQLILGGNGSGKTTLFDVLEVIRDFLTEGNTTIQSFPASTLTAWDKRQEQTIERGIKGSTRFYRSRLVVEHDLMTLKNRIRSVQFNEKLLYKFDGKDAHLFRDNGSAGPVFPLDWSPPGIPNTPARSDNSLVTWFRDLMKIYLYLIVRPLDDRAERCRGHYS